MTRHGEEVAVVVSVEDYKRLSSRQPDFVEFLLSGPDLSVLDLERDRTPMRDIDLGE